MRKLNSFFFAIIVMAVKINVASAISVTQYQVEMKYCHQDGLSTKLIGLRRWIQNGEIRILAVDPQTLKTAVIKSLDWQCEKLSSEIFAELSLSRYFQFIQAQQKKDLTETNAGLNRPSSQRQGTFLTIDLCPSRKSIEKLFFERLFREAQDTLIQRDHQTIHLNIAVSGKWIEHHHQELLWLVESAKQNGIQTLWLNHSYSHPYEKGVDLKNNFLLTPGTDFDAEVLKNEQVMLENDLVPSVFFRFPGLVANQQLKNRLTEFGLIAVGADAWLAKGQQPKSGSLILVHGNGNEPLGIKLFLKALDLNEIFSPFKSLTQY